jgi:cation transport ATPase
VIVFVCYSVSGMLKFWEAVLVDVGVLILVILNGTRPLGFSGEWTLVMVQSSERCR